MSDGTAIHVSVEAAGFVNHVFSLHDRAEVENLAHDAGFRDVAVQTETKALRLPAPDEFLWQYVHSTPLAGAVAGVTDDRRGSLERDVVAKWQEFVEDRALLLQVRVVIVTACK